MFFALRGPHFNANQYAKEAIAKGAKYVVVDDPEFADQSDILLTEDTLITLQQLAHHHRKVMKGTIVGLTGSNGKTTTKELLIRVLEKKYQTAGTKGNLNNHIGVPLTLLSIDPNTEMVVIEMGANKVGDIAELCAIADPNYGLITNIGEAHTEGFGGIEGVIRGKSELFDHLRKNQRTPFINLEDPILKNMAKRFQDPRTYPENDVQFLSATPFIEFQLKESTVKTQLLGAYNFQNIAAAISVGRHFEVDDQDIIDAISGYAPSNQRSQVINKGSLKIIMDAYNANPTSMKAALDSFTQLEGEKHVILADMKELENSKIKHSQFGSALNDLKLDTILLLGSEMKEAASHAHGSLWFEDLEHLKDYLSSNPFSNGNLLIKGSRSMALEKVLEVIN